MHSSLRCGTSGWLHAGWNSVVYPSIRRAVFIRWSFFPIIWTWLRSTPLSTGLCVRNFRSYG